MNATKFVSDLTSEEITELFELKVNGHNDRVRTIAHAIILSAKGYEINKIADIFLVKRDTVSSWIDNWQKNGIDVSYSNLGRIGGRTKPTHC